MSVTLAQLAAAVDAYHATSAEQDRLSTIVDTDPSSLMTDADLARHMAHTAAAAEARDAAWKHVEQLLTQLSADDLAAVRRFRRGVGEWRQFGWGRA